MTYDNWKTTEPDRDDCEPRTNETLLFDAWEAWEADVILNAVWDGDCPRLTQAQWDRMIELQGMRNKLMGRA